MEQGDIILTNEVVKSCVLNFCEKKYPKLWGSLFWVALVFLISITWFLSSWAGKTLNDVSYLMLTVAILTLLFIFYFKFILLKKLVSKNTQNYLEKLKIQNSIMLKFTTEIINPYWDLGSQIYLSDQYKNGVYQIFDEVKEPRSVNISIVKRYFDNFNLIIELIESGEKTKIFELSKLISFENLENNLLIDQRDGKFDSYFSYMMKLICYYQSKNELIKYVDIRKKINVELSQTYGIRD